MATSINSRAAELLVSQALAAPVADTLLGGNGNDFFLVDHPDDLVREDSLPGANYTIGGIDTISSSVDYTLPSYVEVLQLTGNATLGVGNSQGNTLALTDLGGRLEGLGGSDVLVGGRGNDTLLGGADSDSYEPGAGHNLIIDTDLNSGNGISLPPGADLSSIQIARAGNDLVLNYRVSQDPQMSSTTFRDYLLWQNRQLVELDSVKGDLWSGGGVGYSGSAWFINVRDSLLMTEGNDSVVGSTSGDSGWVLAGAGDDYVKTYSEFVYGGLGNDTLIAQSGFTQGFSGGQGHDLLVGDGANTRSLVGGDGQDTLMGGTYMAGGQGDDLFYAGGAAASVDAGSGENLIYVQDNAKTVRIASQGASTANNRVVYLGVDSSRPLDPSQVQLGGDGERLLTLRNRGRLNPEVELLLEAGQTWNVEFANGVVWSLAQMRAMLSSVTDGNDSIPGTLGADTINAGLGNDSIHGRDGDDWLDGGEGNDSVFGGLGNDTLAGGLGSDMLHGGTGLWRDVYRVGRGGNDTILSYSTYDGASHEGEDILELLDGITPSEVSADSNGSFVTLSFQGGGVRIDGFYASSSSTPSGVIDEVVFADGSRWSAEEIAVRTLRTGTEGKDRLVAAATGSSLSGLGGDDYLDGNRDAADTLDGGSGDDALWAYAGRNVMRGGDGNDRLYGEGWLDGGNGDDYLAASSKVDTLLGGAGHDVLDAKAGNDLLTGGVGNDTLSPGEGLDTLTFAAGDGHDLWQVSTDDTVEFGPGISAADLTLVRYPGANSYYSAQASLWVGGGSDRIDLRDTQWKQDSPLAVKLAWAGPTLRFSDGSSANLATLLDAGASTTAVVTGTEGADSLFGLSVDDTLYGLGGNDRLYGDLNRDRLDGGEGNDSLWGDEHEDTLLGQGGADVLRGDAGADWLDGGQGDDVLIGGEGDDTLMAISGADTLSGGAGADVLVIAGSGAPVTVTADMGAQIDFYAADAAANRDTLVLGVLPTDLDITLSSLGDASLRDASGRLLASIDDATIPGSSTLKGVIDVLRFSDGSERSLAVLIDAKHHAGSSGNDTLYAHVGSDILEGGAGDDELYGDHGPVTLSGGQGNDTLYAGGYVSSKDVLLGGEGHDVIASLGGRDTVRGGTGDDTVYGSTAYGDSVSIYFDRGDGRDAVIGASSGTVYLGAGITRADLSMVVTPAVKGLNPYYAVDVLDLDFGKGDRIRYINSARDFNSASDISTPLGAPALVFANGTRLSSAQVLEMAKTAPVARLLMGDDSANLLTGQNGPDTLMGLGGADVLVGGEGDDQLSGGAGNDTLDPGLGRDTVYFSRGDGQDLLTLDGQDSLLLGAGMARADLRVGRLGQLGEGQVLLDFGQGDSLTLTQGGQWGGLTVRFADGAVVTGADIMAEATKPLEPPNPSDLTLSGTAGKDSLMGMSGNDTLSGLAGNDTLAGGLGADRLLGGRGNDTYLFARGDGQDVISDQDGTWFNSDLLRISDASSRQLWLSRTGQNLDIAVIGTTDKVSIEGWFASSRNRVEKITASDGVTLSATKVNNLVNAMAKFAAPTLGQTSLPEATQTALAQVLASSWS